VRNLLNRLVQTVGLKNRNPQRHGQTVPAQQLFRLVLVDFHVSTADLLK
jgi:hypothetical protein